MGRNNALAGVPFASHRVVALKSLLGFDLAKLLNEEAEIDGPHLRRTIPHARIDFFFAELADAMAAIPLVDDDICGQ
ncbi:MAG TPA: hypothetical protein PLL56_11470 [Verrucomicrobiota bacterium]|nr:hypothetical protein [Verrucomicrobiota bacterium]